MSSLAETAANPVGRLVCIQYTRRVLQRLQRRLVRSIGQRLLRRVGRDYVTWMPVQPRRDLERLGSRHGGWVVPTDLLNAGSLCYCVGCGEDISFDLALIERFGCTVFGFDPTPRAIAFVEKVTSGNTKYRFSPLGLWDKSDTLRFFAPKDATHVSHSLLNLQQTSEHIQIPVQRLSDIMRQNGHEALDLLKLDIEGAEYKVLQSILDDQIFIKVLCVEYDEFFHPLDAGYRQRISQSVQQLQRAGYRMVEAYSANYTFIRA